MGEAGGRKILWEGKLGGERTVDGEKSECDGASDIATIGVNVCVQFFEGPRAVGGPELEHIVHSVDYLMEDEKDFAIYKG